MKKLNRILSGLTGAALLIGCLTGCSGTASSEQEDYHVLLQNNLAAATSVETSILVDLQASAGSYGTQSNHNVSLSSDITISSTFNPMEYHAELFSRITVDNIVSKDDQDIYVKQEDENYYEYAYISDTEEWERTKLSLVEVQAIPLRTGMIQDWDALLSNLSEESSTVSYNDADCYVYTGETKADILQQLFGNGIFGSFMYTTEHLLEDELPCEVYINSETNLPEGIELEISNSFIVDDLDFSSGTISVTYSNWNSISEVSVPKKVTVIATDPVQSMYNTYQAWNLFLPYATGESSQGGTGTSGQMFTSAWNTYQIRLDSGIIAIPFTYEELSKAGYKLNESYTSVIVEPNRYVSGIVIQKGNDYLVCSLYNDDTVAQPITSCKIGSISLAASNNTNNGISMYLPGEIILGISRDALLSAYGDADTVTSSFAADTYTWNGDNELQSLVVEISPSSGQVISITLTNIPVTGGIQ